MILFWHAAFIAVSLLSAPTAATVAADQPRVYELHFWPGPNAEHDSRVVRLSNHPCGTVAVARVKTVPPLRKGERIEPERVVELAAGGTVLRRWAIPVDSTPIGVSGNRLLVRFGEIKLWLGLDGRIATAEDHPAPPVPEQARCGRVVEFGNSAFVQCLRFRDLQSGKYRLLVFQGVCT